MTKTQLKLGLIGLAATIAVVVGYALKAEPRGGLTVAGEVTLPPGTYLTAGQLCTGDDDHGDIHEGTQVTVTDATGRVYVTGWLGKGIQRDGRCVFGWRVEHVPGDRVFYAVQIADRRKYHYTRAQVGEYHAIDITDESKETR